MAGQMTIGELASAAGVPTTTVRFYERRRLIVPSARTAANYRVYDAGSLDRLRFIVSAREAGFSLGDVLALLDFADGITPPCREVQALMEERLKRAREQMGRLENVDRRLSAWLRACRRAEKCGRCEVIDRLKAGRRAESAAESASRKNRKIRENSA